MTKPKLVSTRSVTEYEALHVLGGYTKLPNGELLTTLPYGHKTTYECACKKRCNTSSACTKCSGTYATWEACNAAIDALALCPCTIGAYFEHGKDPNRPCTHICRVVEVNTPYCTYTEEHNIKYHYPNSIVFGYGYSGDGAELGLTFDHVVEYIVTEMDKFNLGKTNYSGKGQISKRVINNYIHYSLAQTRGAWLDNRGDVVEEPSVVLTLTQAQGDLQHVLPVLAERIKVEFRQTCVLMTDNEAWVTFVN